MTIKKNSGQVALQTRQRANRKISTTLLTDYERLHGTQLFGPTLTIQGELLVFDLHYHMTGGRNGCSWRSVEFSNGGFYMAPQTDELLHVTWHGNGFDDVLTSDASGIVATLFALNHLLHEFGTARLETMYWKLEDFARGHAESKKILRAID